MTVRKIFFILKSSSNYCNLILKTQVIRSGMAFDRSLDNSSLVISSQFRLHMNVTKKSGGPIAWQIVIAS